MELIIETYGLDLIGINIFKRLKFEDIIECLFVSRSWTNFIFRNKRRLNFVIGSVQHQILEVLKNLLYCQCSKCDGCANLNQKIRNNIDELLLKAVVNENPELFRILLPFAQEEGVDFSAPLPTIEQEPFNKRTLLHNLICTPHCNLELLKILLFELKVDVNRKDVNGCRAIELAVSRVPNVHENGEDDSPSVHLPATHLKAIPKFLQRRDFDIE